MNKGVTFFSPTNLEYIALTFSDLDEPFLVAVDTLELTSHPDDAPSSYCGMESAAWTCEATITLEAEQISCDTEPSGSACPIGHSVSSIIDLPTVPPSWAGSAFNGWIVFTGAGFVRDPRNPTAEELDAIEQLCVDACLQQWSGLPEVAANCETSGAFATPALAETPSIGVTHAISEEREDGSGLFMGASLNCNLEGDCCEAFDEALCHAVPLRATAAKLPLGEGQEWELSVVGSTWADSDNAVAEVDAPMVGTIGYSFCTEGDGVSCPFYVGSMHLELTDTLTLELECNGMIEEHEITELEFDLVQPAMGIAESGTSFKAFPPRALVIEATGEADGFPVYVRGPIEVPIYYAAGEGWTLLQGGGGTYIDLDVPCNGEIAEVKLWWGFEENTVTASPPQVVVSLPDTVACPDELELLLATGSDPDNDVASLEWAVDGVLLSETWPTIDFTEDHEITAILRDARGAATSDTKTVTCE